MQHYTEDISKQIRHTRIDLRNIEQEKDKS